MKIRTVILGGAIAAASAGVAIAERAATQPQAAAVKQMHELGDVKFAFDSAALGVDASRVLDDAVAFAVANPSLRIVLDAHCDPIGNADYNAGLAVRRAESVRAHLVSAGLPEDQIVFAIYGERGARRASYADDRRVTLWPTRAPPTAVIDHTFAGHGIAITWARPLTTAQIASAPEPVASR